MLGGISLLLMERLPQDLVTQSFFGTTLTLAEVQLLWLLIALGIATTLGIVVRSDSWLRRYKYTWAAAGVALLLLTFVFGTEVNGQRLTLDLGPVSGQPSELLKVILVVFLAGYLSENRALIVEQDTRVGPAPAATAAVPRTDGRHVGDRPRHRGDPARSRRGAPVLRRVPRDALRRDRPVQPRDHRPHPLRARQRVDGDLVRDHPDAGRHLARPVLRPARGRLPGRPGAPRIRTWRAGRRRPRCRPARDRRTAADPRRPH
jgi:hypothetical protein